MSESDRLAGQAQDFASRLNDLLRRTVQNEAELQARVDREAVRALVAFGALDGIKLGTIPVRVSGADHVHLLVTYGCALDDERTHLMVENSRVGLYMLDGHREPLFRYEYNRSYTRHAAAHVHVHGQSHALGRLYALAGKREPADLAGLHLPVGGKRFRPTLEDVLECLFVERLLQPLPGWQDAIDKHRSDYQERQLRAAIRRAPAPAVEELRSLGYEVSEPS